MASAFRNLIALSVFGGAALFICPAGGVKRVMGLCLTALLIAAALSPLREFDFDYLLPVQERLESAEAELMQNSGESETLLKKLLLQKNCERYIEGKAEEIGMKVIEATVTLGQEGGGWLPYAVSIRAAGRAEAAEWLCGLIRDELGIPVERQVWTLNE